MLVSAGIVLVIIGVVNLGEGEATTTTNSLIKAGAALLILAWVLLIIASVFSFVGRTANKSDVSFYNGSKVRGSQFSQHSFINIKNTSWMNQPFG